MKVMVVCGGMSSEREVSLRSGKAIFNALKNAGYKDVTLFDLKDDNLNEIIENKPDIAYLTLHGKGGEDGSIQGMLELAGIPYTGPGVASSAVCMNKILTKRVLQSCGLPTAKFIVMNKAECKDKENAANELIEKIGLPMVLKSPCEGSSIGVVIVKNECEIQSAIEEIFKYGDDLLAEEFIDGIELTLPIYGNEEINALPVIEIVSEREFYDFTAKYTEGLFHHIIPARISENERKEVEKIGIDAYRRLGCVGLSRVDFILDKVKGPMIIEVNTLPGMTETSLFPDAAKYAGISFEKLVDIILKLGINTKRQF